MAAIVEAAVAGDAGESRARGQAHGAPDPHTFGLHVRVDLGRVEGSGVEQRIGAGRGARVVGVVRGRAGAEQGEPVGHRVPEEVGGKAGGGGGRRQTPIDAEHHELVESVGEPPGGEVGVRDGDGHADCQRGVVIDHPPHAVVDRKRSLLGWRWLGRIGGIEVGCQAHGHVLGHRQSPRPEHLDPAAVPDRHPLLRQQASNRSSGPRRRLESASLGTRVGLDRGHRRS